MKSRAAIQLNIGEKPVIDEIDIPDPSPHQVAVKMFASGVCHTQLHHLQQKITQLSTPQFIPSVLKLEKTKLTKKQIRWH